MHFYSDTESGIEPRHFVPMAKDPSKLRASRVTDAKKALKEGETWYPSVTTVLNILDKPGLNNWKVDQHLQTVFDSWFDDSEISTHNYELFLKQIKCITQERLDAAPKAGTDIHNVLEKWIRDSIMPSDPIHRDICQNVHEALIKNCGEQNWECEKYFIEKSSGYAGCADLVSDNWVIDYKSKQEASKFKPGKMAYPEHYRQLAAYGYAFDSIDGGGRFGANIFICLETGEVDFHQHTQQQMYDGHLDFDDCLSIYRRNTYDPLA